MALKYISASNMKGPFKLTKEVIVDNVGNNDGVYFLCVLTPFNEMKVKYIGRGYLKTRLEKCLNLSYSYFYYYRANAETKMFRKECEEYHRYGGSKELDNQTHPVKPSVRQPKCYMQECIKEEKTEKKLPVAEIIKEKKLVLDGIEYETDDITNLKNICTTIIKQIKKKDIPGLSGSIVEIKNDIMLHKQ